MMITSQSFAMENKVQKDFNDIFSPTMNMFKAGVPSHETSLMQSSRYSVDADVFLPVEIDLQSPWGKNVPKDNRDLDNYSGRLKT